MRSLANTKFFLGPLRPPVFPRRPRVLHRQRPHPRLERDRPRGGRLQGIFCRGPRDLPAEVSVGIPVPSVALLDGQLAGEELGRRACSSGLLSRRCR